MNISVLKYFGLDSNDNLKLFLFIGSSATIGCLTYVTYKFFLNHRRYSHIPGPPNEGYRG